MKMCGKDLVEVEVEEIGKQTHVLLFNLEIILTVSTIART